MIPNFTWIELSVIESCNRSCSFCPKSNRDDHPNQNLSMSLKLCHKLASELVGWDGTIMIAGHGEPLLHKEILQIVSSFTGLKIEIVSNGDLLEDEGLKDLFDAGLSKLCISLYDGAEQKEKFKEMFVRSGIPENQYELRERWYDFGTITNRAGTVINQTCYENECYYPCYSMTVDWNGDVLLCPQDWRKRVKMGNLSFSTIYEIWGSSNIGKYRKRLLKGKRDLTPCKFCNVNGTKKGLDVANSWKKHYQIKNGEE